MNVQDGDLDAAVAEQLRDSSAYPVAATRQHNHLAIPVVPIRDAIVQGPGIEPGVNMAEDSEQGEELEDLKESRALGGELAALRGILGQQQERERLPGTQNCALNPFSEDIGSEPYSPREHDPLKSRAYQTVGMWNGKQLTNLRVKATSFASPWWKSMKVSS